MYRDSSITSCYFSGLEKSVDIAFAKLGLKNESGECYHCDTKWTCTNYLSDIDRNVDNTISDIRSDYIEASQCQAFGDFIEICEKHDPIEFAEMFDSHWGMLLETKDNGKRTSVGNRIINFLNKHIAINLIDEVTICFIRNKEVIARHRNGICDYIDNEDCVQKVSTLIDDLLTTHDKLDLKISVEIKNNAINQLNRTEFRVYQKEDLLAG